MSNKSNGTAFEKEFAQILSEHGFWVHRMQDNHNGQPFDIIAAKGGRTFVIDCKDCHSGAFQLSRIEENQRLAMMLWEQTGNKSGLFSIRFRDKIYIMEFRKLRFLERNGVKQIPEEYCRIQRKEFERWVSLP